MLQVAFRSSRFHDELEGDTDTVVCHTGPLIDVDMSDIQRAYDTNVFSTIRMAKAVIPHMAARRKGTIVIIGSITSQMYVSIHFVGFEGSS